LLNTAVDSGEEVHAEELEAEIDALLREKKDIEAWATMGTA